MSMSHYIASVLKVMETIEDQRHCPSLHPHVPCPAFHEQRSRFEGSGGERRILLFSGWDGCCRCAESSCRLSPLLPAQMHPSAAPWGCWEVFLPLSHKTTQEFPALAWLKLSMHGRITGERLALSFPPRVSLTTGEGARTQGDRSYSVSCSAELTKFCFVPSYT